MEQLYITQSQFYESLGKLFSLSPVYQWGGGTHGSYHNAIQNGHLCVDSVGLVRTFHELATNGKILENSFNIERLVGNLEEKPIENIVPGDIVYSPTRVGVYIKPNTTLTIGTPQLSETTLNMLGKTHKEADITNDKIIGVFEDTSMYHYPVYAGAVVVQQ